MAFGTRRSQAPPTRSSRRPADARRTAKLPVAYGACFAVCARNYKAWRLLRSCLLQACASLIRTTSAMLTMASKPSCDSMWV